MLAPVSADSIRLIEVRGGLGAVPGVRLAGVHAGIKKRKTDLALIVLEGPHVCAEVVTTNEIKAAPLLASTGHLEFDGEQMQSGRRQRRLRECVHGRTRPARCTRHRASSRNAARSAPDAGRRRIDRRDRRLLADGSALQRSRARGYKALAQGPEACFDAAEAIMTTDHVPKMAAYAWHEGEKRYVVGGIAKGSGMISPSMATMLSFIVTDAPMSRAGLQDALREATDGSFNMISVDGDMSTNDSCYAFAKPGTDDGARSGLSRRTRCGVQRPRGPRWVRDGEGATKTLVLNVTGAKDETQARTIARAVINSSLVKTALYGEDPNWGRVIAAAGAARAGLDPEKWSLKLGGQTWVEPGAIEVLSEAEAHLLLEEQTIEITLDLAIGNATATGWGCDFSTDYVRINAHYRT